MSENQLNNYQKNKDKILEKRKQYYKNNKDVILEKSKQYYYNNIDARKKYNNDYWALHGHKYIEQRCKDNELKLKQREYNKTYYDEYKERPKYIFQNNYFVPPSKKDFIVSFPSY